MKRYRFEALVTPSPAKGGSPPVTLNATAHRMVLRAKHHETQRSQIFSVLVAGDGDEPFRRETHQFMVTLNVVGDDVCDYLEIGSRFSLWNGADVGQGVVTRRLVLL